MKGPAMKIPQLAAKLAGLKDKQHHLIERESSIRQSLLKVRDRMKKDPQDEALKAEETSLLGFLEKTQTNVNLNDILIRTVEVQMQNTKSAAQNGISQNGKRMRL